MKGSRIVAVGLVAVAALWIASGHFASDDKSESQAATAPAAQPAAKRFRVAVVTTQPEQHRRKLTLSGRTEANHKLMMSARTSGVIAKLNVRRGSVVKEGDVIASLSDEAREAQTAQARALVAQRKSELEAKRRLIETGALPRLDLGNLEAQLKAAEASQAAAEAEQDRSSIVAPWAAVVTDVPVDPGQAVSPGKEIVQIVALDPLVIVVEVSERKLFGVQPGAPATIRLINGQTANGQVRFVSKSASATTRTYRVEIEVPNKDGAIPDGITAEASLTLASEPATRVPRSALTFASSGELGVRAVDASDKVGFLPVTLVEDEQNTMYVAGIPAGARVIVQGQDFVREGQTVEPVAAEAASAR